MKKNGRKLPSALRNLSLEKRLSNSTLAVFLDYDGTLTPIVDDPSRAVLSQKSRSVLKKLSTLCQVIILSGRDVKDVRKMVGLKSIIYVGSHGFDIAVRSQRIRVNTNWDKFLPTLNDAEELLRAKLKDLPSVIVERKKFSISVHYRKVPKSYLAILKLRFNRTAAQFPSLKKTKGKRILELLPNTQWNKGAALNLLLDTLWPNSIVVPIFIGDDLTDEGAFCAIKNNGVGIFVGKCKRGTCAKYSLRNSIEVRDYLERLAQGLRNTIQ